ncbi:MAG: hypothetical protein CME68_10620 [Halobacteriovoraceae bacterium]|nr:hypothetical protein [Halobacteriovoraceae bacterium]
MKKYQLSLKNSFLIIFLLLSVTSCLPKVPEAKWVYGTWIEALSGNKIEFFKDGKVTWFGKKGIFTFVKNSKNLCIQKCPDGELKIEIESKTYRTSYSVENKKKHWEMNFIEEGGNSFHHYFDGKKSNVLHLYNEESEKKPTKPVGFKRLDDGLNYYNTLNSVALVNGKLVGTIWGGETNLAIFNKGIGEWINISPREKINQIGSVYYGNRIILNRHKNGDKYSLDTGNSWKNYPSLGDVEKGAANVNPIFLNYDAFQMVLISKVDPEKGSMANRYGLYKTNLKEDKPTWKEIYRLPNNLNGKKTRIKILGNEKTEEIYIFSYPDIINGHMEKEDVNLINHRLYLSRNKGKKFHEIALPPIKKVWGVKSYDSGFVMKVELENKKGKSLIWYLSKNKEWRFVDLKKDLDSWYPVKDYVISTDLNNNILKIDPNGSIREVLYLGNNSKNIKQSSHLAIAGEEIFFSSYTIWKLKNKW